jgi:hypothetical protein
MKVTDSLLGYSAGAVWCGRSSPILWRAMTALMMEAVRISETRSTSMRLHGAISQKTAILKMYEFVNESNSN